MVTIIISIRLEIPGVDSLKGKRRIIKSLTSRLRNNFNISIAEVGDNDIHRSAQIGVAFVSNNKSYGHQVASKIINRIESNPEIVLTEYNIDSY